MDYQTIDYLIIGQGLAGSCLALHLIEKQKRVLVIDSEDYRQAASQVAAGIFNPITGKNMVKTWKADSIFPYLENFYKKWERELGKSFFHQKNIYRPFNDVEEQNDWMGKSTQEQYQDYIHKVHTVAQYPEKLFDQYGGVCILKSGFVDLPKFLLAVKEYLKAKDSYTAMKLEEDRIEIEDTIKYNEIIAKKIIYCSGNQVNKSKFFDWLPHQPVKGEILEMTLENPKNEIFNKGVFILPVSDTLCRVGATYEQKDLTINITEKGKRTLLEKFHTLYRGKYRIIDHVAGIRPATKDRRPFVGVHPTYQQIGIFGGLGAKGVSLAPYFSKQLVDVLEGNSTLDKEVNINRYFSKRTKRQDNRLSTKN